MDVAPSAETTAAVADEPRVAEPSPTAPAADETLLEEELLVEEVSIDGMCGVY